MWHMVVGVVEAAQFLRKLALAAGVVVQDRQALQETVLSVPVVSRGCLTPLLPLALALLKVAVARQATLQRWQVLSAALKMEAVLGQVLLVRHLARWLVAPRYVVAVVVGKVARIARRQPTLQAVLAASRGSTL